MQMWEGSVLLGLQNADLCLLWLVHLDLGPNQFSGPSLSIMIHLANVLAIWIVHYHLSKVSLSAL